MVSARSAGSPQRSGVIVIAAMLAAALVTVLALLWRQASGYFFLFDDFALVELARTHSAAQLFAEPLIGYYRPLPFVVLHAETMLFGWKHPAGYLAVGLAFHAANAALCAWLTSQLARWTLAPLIAFVLVLASPWATETFLWASGLFDVMATLGVLLALIGVRLTVTSEVRSGGRGRASVGVVLAGAGALLGAFSKESAVVLPALAVVILLVDRPVKALIGRTTMLAVVACSVPVLVYLLARASVLGMFSGAYGDFGALWNEASLIKNIYSYARALALVPMRPPWPPYVITFDAVLRYAFAFAALPAALLSLAMSRPRLLAACVMAFLLSTLPVCWFGLTVDSTVAGRYAYLPVMLGAIALAAGLACISDLLLVRVGGIWPTSALAAVPLMVTLACVGASLWYQADVWRSACRLSRGVLMQLERYRGRGGVALDIQNMPFEFVEGPYILKAYAFRFYRDDGGSFPPVKAHGWNVKFVWGGQAIASLGIDPTSEYLDRPPAGLTEEAVRLTLTP